jgi:hypothetical protein
MRLPAAAQARGSRSEPLPASMAPVGPLARSLILGAAGNRRLRLRSDGSDVSDRTQAHRDPVIWAANVCFWQIVLKNSSYEYFGCMVEKTIS